MRFADFLEIVYKFDDVSNFSSTILFITIIRYNFVNDYFKINFEDIFQIFIIVMKKNESDGCFKINMFAYPKCFLNIIYYVDSRRPFYRKRRKKLYGIIKLII